MKPRKFRLLVTGSREWPDVDAHIIHSYLDWAFAIALTHSRLELVIVHGHCQSGRYRGGVDRYADEWCAEVSVDPERHPANWHQEGNIAGFQRNLRMVSTRPDMCIAFSKGDSRGTAHCYAAAIAAGIPSDLIRYEALK